MSDLLAVAELKEQLEEARRLLGYLWTATGMDENLEVRELFADDDPLVADVERLAIFYEERA